MENKLVKHPATYTIFKPNVLIKGDESQLKGSELRIYEEILNANHKETPDKLTYQIPYSIVFTSKTNVTENKKRLSRGIQSRVVFLDKAFMKEAFNEDYDQGISLFPTVKYRDDHFEVEIHPTFKRILVLATDYGFTKGDIETIRTFKHDISHFFYFSARNRQVFRSKWTISIKEFKEELNIEGYNDIRNFKKRVIEPIYEDMKGTWMEFDKDCYLKKGKGNRIVGLEFKFKKGPKDEQDVPAGHHFRWEKTLMALQIEAQLIKKLRQMVKAGSETELEDGRVILWDSEYIYYSIEGATKEYKEILADKKRKQIKKKTGWFVNGLYTGQWLDYVEEQRQNTKDAVQAQLF